MSTVWPNVSSESIRQYWCTRAAECRIKAPFVERLLQPLGFPHIGMQRAVVEWVDPALFGFGVLIDEQFHAGRLRHGIAQLVHFLKLPRRIDVQQGERRRRRIKCLARQMEHDRAVLAHRIQHHRIAHLCHHFTHDVDGLCLQAGEVGQGRSIRCAGHGYSLALLGRKPDRPWRLALNLPYGSKMGNGNCRGDFQRISGVADQRCQPLRIEATGIGHDFDPARLDRGKMRPAMQIDEIRR